METDSAQRVIIDLIEMLDGSSNPIPTTRASRKRPRSEETIVVVDDSNMMIDGDDDDDPEATESWDIPSPSHSPLRKNPASSVVLSERQSKRPKTEAPSVYTEAMLLPEAAGVITNWLDSVASGSSTASSSSSQSQQDPCSICTDNLPSSEAERFRLDSCAHTYCRSCIRDWVIFVKTSKTTNNIPNCPICRALVTAADVEKLMTLPKTSPKSRPKMVCPVPGCHARVVDLKGHTARMHQSVVCNLCGDSMPKQQLKKHQEQNCGMVQTRCPMPKCIAIIDRAAAQTFVLRYWEAQRASSDVRNILARDLVQHHHCTGVSMCVECTEPTHFITVDELNIHFSLRHSVLSQH